MTVRPTARALNLPLLIAGVERRLLGLGVAAAALALGFNNGGAISQAVTGTAIFLATIYGAQFLTRKDDRMLQIAPSVWLQKPKYDPLKRSAR